MEKGRHTGADDRQNVVGFKEGQKVAVELVTLGRGGQEISRREVLTTGDIPPDGVGELVEMLFVVVLLLVAEERRPHRLEGRLRHRAIRMRGGHLLAERRQTGDRLFKHRLHLRIDGRNAQIGAKAHPDFTRKLDSYIEGG